QRTYQSFQRTGIGFDWVDGQACREILPILSPETRAGIYTPRSGHANPQRTVQAFAWAFQDLGGTLLEHTPVHSVDAQDGQVTGVRTAGGRIQGEQVILCAAAYNAKLLEPFGVVFPSAPVRLEAL